MRVESSVQHPTSHSCRQFIDLSSCDFLDSTLHGLTRTFKFKTMMNPIINEFVNKDKPKLFKMILAFTQ